MRMVVMLLMWVVVAVVGVMVTLASIAANPP
jgi:hypothetical protein